MGLQGIRDKDCVRGRIRGQGTRACHVLELRVSRETHREDGLVVCRVGEPQKSFYVLRLAIRSLISGVRINCMAKSILPPGTTMVLRRDMNESLIIDSRY